MVLSNTSQGICPICCKKEIHVHEHDAKEYIRFMQNSVAKSLGPKIDFAAIARQQEEFQRSARIEALHKAKAERRLQAHGRDCPCIACDYEHRQRDDYRDESIYSRYQHTSFPFREHTHTGTTAPIEKWTCDLCMTVHDDQKPMYHLAESAIDNLSESLQVCSRCYKDLRRKPTPIPWQTKVKVWHLMTGVPIAVGVLWCLI